MKIRLGILFFYLLIAFQIKMTGQTENKQTVVTGNIKTNWSNQIQLGDSIISIAENGTFQFKLILEKPKFFNLIYEYKNIKLFLTPGQNIHISCDGKNFPRSLIFEGKNSDLNTFLLNQTKWLFLSNTG